MKTRIYKVPFYVVTENHMDFFCEKPGSVVVRKNILGNNNEIITGFNKFNKINNFEYDSYKDYLYGIRKLKNNKDYYELTREYGFALFLKTGDFKDKNLATIKDIEEWEENFKNSEFYLYYQQMHIFDKDESKAIKDKVKSISKRRFNGKF